MTNKVILILAIIALLTMSIAFQTWICWDGADIIPVLGGIVTIDAYDGMIRVPMFDITFCHHSANCSKY